VLAGRCYDRDVPYRVSDRQRDPESPDVDVNLLRKPWSARALVVSVVYVPFLAWWLVMVEGGSGPRQVSPGAKVAIAVAFGLWLVVLLIFRARHQRVVEAAVARMEREAVAATSRVRIAEEPPSARAGAGEDDELDDADSRRSAQRRR
jgi:hypothetical protein